MEKEMEKGMNTIKTVKFGLNVNIYIMKELKVKNITKEIWYLKENFYLIDLILEIGMI